MLRQVIRMEDKTDWKVRREDEKGGAPYLWYKPAT